MTESDFQCHWVMQFIEMKSDFVIDALLSNTFYGKRQGYLEVVLSLMEIEKCSYYQKPPIRLQISVLKSKINVSY